MTSHNNRIDLSEAYYLHNDRIHAYALQLTRNFHDAEELTSNTWLRFSKTLEKNPDFYDPSLSQLSTFLNLVTYHIWIDDIRKKMRNPIKTLECYDFDDVSKENSLTSVSGFSLMSYIGEHPIEVLERKNIVDKCMKKIPDKFRTLLELQYWHGFSSETIASLVGLQPRNTRLKLCKARELFKQEYVTADN